MVRHDPERRVVGHGQDEVHVVRHAVEVYMRRQATEVSVVHQIAGLSAIRHADDVSVVHHATEVCLARHAAWVSVDRHTTGLSVVREAAGSSEVRHATEARADRHATEMSAANHTVVVELTSVRHTDIEACVDRHRSELHADRDATIETPAARQPDLWKRRRGGCTRTEAFRGNGCCAHRRSGLAQSPGRRDGCPGTGCGGVAARGGGVDSVAWGGQGRSGGGGFSTGAVPVCVQFCPALGSCAHRKPPSCPTVV